MNEAGLFDWQERFEQLSEGGDPLVKLNNLMDWNMFAKRLKTLRDKERKSNAGRKPFDATLMFKILILQSLYNLSDDQMEFQIRDRLSFMRFLDLSLHDRVPDAKTIWLFREQLTEAQLTKKLFDQFDHFLRKNGFAAQKGQIVDASIVRAPKQRNSRKENKQIKQGHVPDGWSDAKKRQKDTEARWIKKNGLNQFGYKNHIEIDVKHKLIRNYTVTDAATHDSHVFEEILDMHNSSKEVWTDSAYRTPDNLGYLHKHGFREHIQRKGYRYKKLTEREKAGNYTRAKTRSRIEHIFGVQAQRAGTLLIRTIGKIRATTKIGLRNLAFNMDRYCMLVTT